MSNKMPKLAGMPLPQQEMNDQGEQDSSPELSVPSHLVDSPDDGFKDDEPKDLPRPSLINPSQNDSVKKVTELLKGIEVVAEREGFYNQSRIQVGQQFLIKDWSKLGSWMRCVDPSLEKQHQEEILSRKKASKR